MIPPNLPLAITSAWESSNEASICLASALHAIRTEEIDTPTILRRPSKKALAQDQLGQVLLLAADAKRHARDLVAHAEGIEAIVQQQLAGR
jgi:hypothetical protein